MAEFSYSGPVKPRIPPRTIRRRRLLLMVPAVFIILLFLYIVGYKAGAQERELRDYIQQTNSFANKSNAVAEDLEKQLKRPSQKSKASFRTDIMDMVQECSNIRDYAEAMIVPEEFQKVHSYFIMAMKLRHEGMSLYKPQIFEALSSSTPKLKEKKITKALKYLSFSDFAYENFKQELNKIVKSYDLDIKITDSIFLGKYSLYQKENIMGFVKKLKKEKVKDAGDVAILDVATVPLRVSINTNTQVRVLPLTSSVKVRIEVENKGKIALNNIPVEIELITKGRTSGEKKQGKIDKLPVNGTTKITLEGFSPSESGLNKLKIKVGPVFGEQETDDNYYEYKFIIQENTPSQSQDTSNTSTDTSTSTD